MAGATIKGRALAFVERPYQSWTDRQTGEVRPAGITRTLWVGPDFASEPVQVKVSEPVLPLVAEVQLGDSVECECQVYANGNKVSYGLTNLTVGASA